MDDVPLAKFQNSFSIFDYDEIDLIEKAKDLVNIPCRIFNCNDKKQLEISKRVVINGPMGVFEMPNFAKGTNAIAQVRSL